MEYEDFLRMTPDQLCDRRDSCKKRLFNLRFQRASHQKIDTSLFRKIRREVARIETALSFSRQTQKS